MSVHACRAKAVLVALMLAGAVAAGPDEGLVGWWRFDETGGLAVVDGSGNGRDGQILADAQGVEHVAGRSGGALAFTGGPQDTRGEAGCVAIAGLGEIDWSRGLTIEVWVRFDELVRPSTYEIVSNTVADRGPGFRLMLSWASLWLRSGEGGSGRTWGAGSDPSVTALRTGEWYHLAGTYDGSVFRVYVDGALVGESEPGLTLTPGEPTVWVGSYRAGFAYGLTGAVDDLRLYSTARSAAQIVMDAKLGTAAGAAM